MGDRRSSMDSVARYSHDLPLAESETLLSAGSSSSLPQSAPEYDLEPGRDCLPVSSSCSSHHMRRNSLKPIWRRIPSSSLLIGLVLGTLATMLVTAPPSLFSKSSLARLRPWTSWTSAVKLDEPARTQRLFIREHANEEGIGSALQRLKGGIIIATKVLDSTWLVGETQSDHRYYHDDVLNPKAFGGTPYDTIEIPIGRICRLHDYLPRKERDAVIRGACKGAGPGYEQGLELKRKMDQRGCTVILEDIVDEVLEDLNACYRDFVRERIGGREGRRLEREPGGDPTALSIGIHIRWGDAAMFEGTMEAPRGSMEIVHINEIISTVRARFARLDIRVVMENANATVLGLLDFTDYILVDSQDSFADLFQLGDNDLTLLGSSSYSALAHIVAPSRGISIIEGPDKPNKYTDSDHRIALLNCAAGIDYISRLEEMFPEVETR